MYLLTYVGRWMNGLTLLVVIWCGLFSVPRVYRDNKAQIDEALAPIKAKIDEAMAKVRASMPAGTSAAKKEE